MFQSIRKRNHQTVPFQKEKITAAILKAGNATGEFGSEMAEKLTLRVLNLALQSIGGTEPSVEQIQDIVEDVLLASPYKKTAKAYILYREQHARLRDLVSRSNVNLIDQYLEKLDWQVNENSNMAYSLQGLNNYIASEISKVYWLNKIYPAEIRTAHQEGDFHIHDLGMLSVYCVGWDLQELIQTGFKGAEGKVESRPARHFRSILGQIVNFFYTLQGEAAGAQAFSSFDTLLAPFVRFDNLSYKEVRQALQEFVFNINVPTRVGFQTPFTNITLDLTVPKLYEKAAVVIGGEKTEHTYGEFQHEMNMINQAFLEVMSEGDAQGRVFTFPIPTYNITRDFDWDNPVLDYLWEATGKYGIPYFSNYVNSSLKPEDARSMCCRLRLDTRKLEARGGGLFGANPLTGSIGVVTMNLPRIAHNANSEEDFFSRLEPLMTLAKNSLEIKRKVLEQLTGSGLYPYTRFYLRNVFERFGRYWTNHFSTIGLLGMNEACLNLLGKDIGTDVGQDFAGRVLDWMRERLTAFQMETGHNYNLEATPAEGTSFRLAKLDKERWPNIKVANENLLPTGVKPFYTNSSQLPVNYSDDVFEALDKQDGLQTRYTGGTVLHVFGGERLHRFGTVKNLVRTICQNYRLPYFTFTPTFSVCPSHGYLSGEHRECPHCHTVCEVYSRVTGYLRPISQWNEGKRAEFDMRKTFHISEGAQ